MSDNQTTQQTLRVEALNMATREAALRNHTGTAIELADKMIQFINSGDLPTDQQVAETIMADTGIQYGPALALAEKMRATFLS